MNETKSHLLSAYHRSSEKTFAKTQAAFSGLVNVNHIITKLRFIAALIFFHDHWQGRADSEARTCR
jgi:hypothetical protein